MTDPMTPKALADLRTLLVSAVQEMGRGFHPGNMADALLATPSGRALLERAERAERLEAALAAIPEWFQQYSNSNAECVSCGRYEHMGHSPRCRRIAALAAPTHPEEAE